MVRIAIDGPGGAGKSSVAKAVAKQLGIVYVDTGALYRTIGLYMVRSGINTKDPVAVPKALGDFSLDLKFTDGKQVILLNGEAVGDSIRAPEISMAASDVSAMKEVREYLLNTQRSIAKNNSVIMDGRDIGTVILPDAEVKIFLTASPEARAKRRFEELKAKGKNVTYEQVYAEMVERDKNDSTRAIAPCIAAEDAIILDNSNLNEVQTVKKVIKIIKQQQKKIENRFYKAFYVMLAGPVRFFQRIKASGTENIPKDGGFLICANHIAAKDVILIAACSTRQIRFIAKKELFKVPILGGLIKRFGAIKLDRGGSDVGAIKKAVELAKNGEAVAIFPQGHRYPGVNPADTPTKNGAALIAYHTGCDILPVCIKTKNNKYKFFRKVEIIFGRPIKNCELNFDKGGSTEYKKATEIIFNNILSLGGFSKTNHTSAAEEVQN